MPKLTPVPQPPKQLTPKAKAFQLAGGSQYDPNAHYTRQSDQHGHRSEARVKYPPHYEGVIGEAISLVAEYKSPQDVLLDGLIHNLARIAKQHNSEVLQQFVDTEAVAIAVEQSKNERMARVELLKDFQAEALALTSADDAGRLTVLLDMAESLIVTPTWDGTPEAVEMERIVDRFDPIRRRWMLRAVD